jgi:hypothetical protein
MTAAEEALIRAAVALQVATIEHANGQDNPRDIWHAMLVCKNRIAEAIADIRREDRAPPKGIES